MLNTDSRKRSAVGRISRDEGDARLRPFNRPPTTRIATLLVLWLEVAFAVIAALWTAWRTIAIGLGLVARACFLAAGALHQHAAALAVGDQRVLARWLERLFAARRVSLAVTLVALFGARKIRARKGGDLFAELLAQHAGLDLLDLTFGQLAQLE